MNKVNIYGGLGNQMFQYALKIALQSSGARSRISFRDFFVYQHHHGFELPLAFQLQLSVQERVKYWLLTNGKHLWKSKIVRKALHAGFYLKSRVFEKCVQEKQEFVADSSIFQIRDSRLIGTWQATGYFTSHEAEIRKQFKFNVPTDRKNLELMEEIRLNNSVAVHIRRGDYTKEEWRHSHMVFKNLSYYYNAIELFSDKMDSPIFYFFSDDVDWVKSNFKGQNFRFIDHNKNASSYMDMYLMSLCQGFIIANSTFSWWAAWLSDTPNKQVVMPQTWIKGAYTPGVFQEGWIIAAV
ncbi:alpha-1,2-fucosyltransferase [Algoriphagus sp.]|uniref:alpha-1,2-fucosyltransferase n=1 Tax=Algoriphagus sp. TaxID=1872435 RepID=UPI003F70D134